MRRCVPQCNLETRGKKLFSRTRRSRVAFALLFACCASVVVRGGVPGADKSEYSFLSVGQVPVDGLVLEAQVLDSHPDRALLLWMLHPSVHPNFLDPDDIYTCPARSRGSYYRGSVRVSLVDTKAGMMINTVKIKPPVADEGEVLEIPYAIRRGHAYRVEGNPGNGEEVRPKLIWLKDYNGDGKALEFALIEAAGCMGLQTTLLGYSEKQDKVIQYPFELAVEEDGRRSIASSRWCDYIFSDIRPEPSVYAETQPLEQGRWKFCIDYRGRLGDLDEYEIHYNAERETFEGTLKITHP